MTRAIVFANLAVRLSVATAPEPNQEEAKHLARRIALLSGETEDQAVVISLRERLERLENRRRQRHEFEELRRQWRSLPSVDEFVVEDWLYDDSGLPK